jgi:peptidoglycan-associated lipoprotein
MVSRAALLSTLVVLVCACGDKPPPATPQNPPPAQTTAPPPQSSAALTRGTSNVGVADDLARACSIQFGDAERAPKFDYAHTDLLPEDKTVLDQVGRCVTTGPLKGRSLKLVGRADSRGEAEYNMTLGEHRADMVRRYLDGLGVDDKRISETSRGKLDASGSDESGWRRDRRVDIMLQ